MKSIEKILKKKHQNFQKTEKILARREKQNTQKKKNIKILRKTQKNISLKKKT